MYTVTLIILGGPLLELHDADFALTMNVNVLGALTLVLTITVTNLNLILFESQRHRVRQPPFFPAAAASCIDADLHPRATLDHGYVI